MLRSMPKMEVIEAFMEAAREPNFRTAATRCAISTATFSRRIRTFTQFAGRPLFEKGPDGMMLTAAGKECLAALQPTYNGLRRAAASIAPLAADRKVTLSVSHLIATEWLAPRLERFRNLHLDLEVEITIDRNASLIREGKVDLGICAGDVDVVGLKAERLLNVQATPVACPQTADLLAGANVRLLEFNRLAIRQQPKAWSQWSAESGIEIAENQHILEFESADEMYEAAASGLGIALGTNLTVEPHLQSGRVVALGWPASHSFHDLIYPSHRPLYDGVWALATWLRAEADCQLEGSQPKSGVKKSAR